MDNMCSSSLDGFGDMEEKEINRETKSEFYVSPTTPEILFEEAVQKLNKYERSLESLVKRFSVNGVETVSEVGNSQFSKKGQDSSAIVQQRTNLSTGSDYSVYRSSGDVQKYVKIQIPYHTAEIVLRILDEDMDKIQRSVLKQAESCLQSVKENLANLRQMLEIQCENSDQPKKITLMKTIEIADDMFGTVDKLNEKLLDCQIQNLSELLAISVKEEDRLSRLAARNESAACPVPLVNNEQSSSARFYAFLFCFVALCLMVRLMMLYLEIHEDVSDSICQYVASVLGRDETVA